MSRSLLPAVEINPSGPIKISVIWMHGLGADGHDFEPIAPELRLPDGLGVRFVFPHAPRRAVTINNGAVMPAWYDIAGPDLGREPDFGGMQTSEEAVAALVRRELEAGVLASNVLLAGFSQGGVIALRAGLRFPAPLAGVMALSTYLPGAEGFMQDAGDSGPAKLPIFMGHGVMDPVIPIQAGRDARTLLARRGCLVEWREYPMAHSVCSAEVQDIRAWLLGLFGS